MHAAGCKGSAASAPSAGSSSAASACCRHALEQVVLGQDSQARAQVWPYTKLPGPFQKSLGPMEQEAKVHNLKGHRSGTRS